MSVLLNTLIAAGYVLLVAVAKVPFPDTDVLHEPVMSLPLMLPLRLMVRA